MQRLPLLVKMGINLGWKYCTTSVIVEGQCKLFLFTDLEARKGEHGHIRNQQNVGLNGSMNRRGLKTYELLFSVTMQIINSVNQIPISVLRLSQFNFYTI